MKKRFILFSLGLILLFSNSLFGYDKIKIGHYAFSGQGIYFIAGGTAGITGYLTDRIIRRNSERSTDGKRFEAFLVGVGSAALTGLGKELIWDGLFEKEVPKSEDFFSFLEGGIVGATTLYMLEYFVSALFIGSNILGDKQNVFIQFNPYQAKTQLKIGINF